MGSPDDQDTTSTTTNNAQETDALAGPAGVAIAYDSAISITAMTLVGLA